MWMPVSMKDAIISIGLVAVVLAVAFILPASAALPDHTGASYPATFWSKMGKTNTVTGKIIASSNASLGLEGAYVAIVNASNVREEYCNTTSDASGNYTFTDVNATYFQKHDPDNDPLYKVYAYKEPYGEGYSATFGVDVASLGSPMVVWVVIPVTAPPVGAPVKATVGASPTATSTPLPVESTPVPDDRSWSVRIAIIVAVNVLALAGTAYLYIRRR